MESVHESPIPIVMNSIAIDGDTAESLDFEVLSHSPSMDGNSIVELLHSLTDGEVREKIINDVQSILDDNRKLKESLVETNQEMAEQYEKLKSWVEARQHEDKQKEAKENIVVKALEDIKNEKCILESEVSQLNGDISKINGELEKAKKQTSNLEAEKAELLEINFTLRSQGLNSCDARSADYSIVEREGSGDGDVNTKSLALTAKSMPSFADSCMKSDMSTQCNNASVEPQEQILELTKELSVESKKLHEMTLRCDETKNLLAKHKQEYDEMKQSSLNREVALKQEVINLQKKCTEMEEKYRKTGLEQLQMAAKGKSSSSEESDKSDTSAGASTGNCRGAAGGNYVQVDYLTGVLLQRDDELKTRDMQIEKLKQDVKKVMSDSNDRVEHWKAQARVWQSELVSVTEEKDRCKLQLMEERACKQRYEQAYHRLSQRLNQNDDRTDGESYTLVLPTTETGEHFPPRGGIDEVDNTDGPTDITPATDANTLTTVHELSEPSAEPDLTCPLCAEKWASVGSLQRHVNQCLEEDEQRRRREEQIEL